MTTRKLTRAALIAAVYATLTLSLPMLSFVPQQLRFAEALTVLPFVFPEAIPGLFVGCLLANLGGVFLGATTIIDVFVGPIATLIAAFLTYKSKRLWLAPLPPVLVNAIIIGLMLSFVYAPEAVWASFPVFAAEVGIGQVLACYGCGIPLLIIIGKLPKRTGKLDERSIQ